VREQVREIMARVFEVPAGTVGDDAAFGDIVRWTSLTHTVLIAQIEHHFKIRVSNDEFQEMINFRNVCAVVHSHLSGR